MSGQSVGAVGAYAAALMLTLTTVTLPADENARPAGAGLEQPSPSPDTDSRGTGPGGMGSTGWTGGSRGSTPGVGSRGLTGVEAQDRAADQTLMATGVDLNGPPTRFPASETPE